MELNKFKLKVNYFRVNFLFIFDVIDIKIVICKLYNYNVRCMICGFCFEVCSWVCYVCVIILYYIMW